MNIGDGLLFELENGKPKLILLKPGAEKKPGKPLSLRPRPTKVLSSRQPSCVEEVQGDERPAQQQAGRHREVKNKAEGDTSSAHSSIPITQTEGRKTRRQDQPRQDRVKRKTTTRCAAVRQKEGGTGEKGVLVDAEAGLKDRTPAQRNNRLQQILNNFQTSCGDKGDQMGPKSRGSEPTQRGEEGKEKLQERESTVNAQDSVSRASGCTFSWLEERLPHSEAASGAEKAQKALHVFSDEQVEHHSAHVRLQGGGVSTSRTEQHAAIRSSLRLGDVSPIEMQQNMEKKEEQRRRWLQELDCQRQEMMERRRQEKLLRNQLEDQERWMAHFDSFQRRAPARAEVQARWGPSSSLSLAWDASSSCGADSLVGASLDSTSRCQTRSSYLRTMTSLLDPAQIEERERRRAMQLEQQTAIEAQMEERRKLREEEDAKRREEEEREERRLGREREMLQRQYELETRKEKEPLDAGVHAASLLPDAGLHALGLQPDAGLHTAGLQMSGGIQREAGPEHAGASSLRDTAVQTEIAASVQTLDVAVQYQPPLSRPTAPPNSRRPGKENMGEPAGDQYDRFARKERKGGGKRRPEWNSQRPSRRFVPASERYPHNLQRSRLKRQAELLARQERARPVKAELPAPHPSQPGRTSAPPCEKVETGSRERRGSALRPDRCQQPPRSPPPEFVPYVRTDAVHLDPLELADTPPPHTNPGVPPHLSAPPAHTRRQQQILKGLAQLRQGLLQKQKELEMDLNPPTASASHQHPP